MKVWKINTYKLGKLTERGDHVCVKYIQISYVDKKMMNQIISFNESKFVN